MKRDIFRRSTRMQHYFGELETRNDPLMGPSDSFDPKFPIVHNNMDNRRNNSGPLEIQRFGRHDMGSPSRSGVCKPSGGVASLDGPEPDQAENAAAPLPASTQMRTQPVVGTRFWKGTK
jgi:hypothetical protein